MLVEIALALQLQDTTLRVPAGTRLEVNVGAGSIAVTGWDRPDVRVTAKTGARNRIKISLDGSVLRLTGIAAGGVAVADLAISAPRAMSLRLGSGDVDITVKDSDGDVSVFNYRGTIAVGGGRGTVSLRSTLGEIQLAGAKGSISVETLHQSITLADVIGDVRAKSSSGHVTLTRVDGRHVNAETVGGVIRFSGPLRADGQYSFATHTGAVWLSVRGVVDATVSVATVSGAFSSPIPYRVIDRRRAGIFTAVFGNGSAQVNLESFAGGIVVR